MTAAATPTVDATMVATMTDTDAPPENLTRFLTVIDAALARFSGAELASAAEVCDVLLDLRLIAASDN